MEFKDELRKYTERLENIKDTLQTEEATKMSLIVPFFQLLGYDVFNPLEFCPEYTADIGIKKGEKVAFVGENGSGKTTLVKLLLRLYDCSSGEILYNGMPVEKMNTRTYRSAYSTLFQDFNLYAASVAENVSMNQNPDLEKVREALICARIPKAADQLDGIISKEFCADGIDFSGGERQRIALARVFYENHDILIMDEPTAAMDIRFEKEFYDLVFSYLKDKTILMISHRLASITACDRIFYMENGSITEQGTHQELMEKQGKYAKLFLAQLN